MNGYLWILIVACVGSALNAGTVLARDAAGAANRRVAILSLSACFWAACEIAWNTAPDAAAALRLVKLSAPGWIFIGPMSAHVFLEATGSNHGWRRRVLCAGYAADACLLALEWTTPWLHPGVIRTEWGWAYRFGPLFPVFFAVTLGSLAVGIATALERFPRSASPGELRQLRLVKLAIAIPLVVASITDGVLPYLGHQPPRLGTLALALLAMAITWGIHRHGFSLLAPGRFAAEIFEAISDAVVLVRPNGEVRIANRAAAWLAGRTSAQLAGLSVEALLPRLGLDLEQPVLDVEGELARADGKRIPVAVSSSPLHDKLGFAIGVVLVVRDLRELTELRSQLVVSGRLAAVGELAAGIAHEINNPISYVRSNLGLLGAHWRTLAEELEKAGRADAVAEAIAEGDALLDESLDGIDRVAAIVRDVRSVSHAGGGEARPVDLLPVLERVVRVAARRFDARIAMEIAAIPLVLGDAQELEQVFLNLVMNAGQAVRPGGRIRIAAAPQATALEIAVEDDGVGIPPENLERVFDPFFTTKPQGEGTGLGLAISYQIVRQHGGRISVASSPGRTVFRVSLPLAPASDAEPPVSSPA